MNHISLYPRISSKRTLIGKSINRMKRHITYLFLIFLSSHILLGQESDKIYFKGKGQPVNCKLLIFENGLIQGKITYIENEGTSVKERPLRKINIILTKDQQLYVEPAKYKEARDLEGIPYDLIFLRNENLIATDEWFDDRDKGEYKYIDYVTSEEGTLTVQEVVAIYDRDKGLEIMDIKSALPSLRTAKLPEFFFDQDTTSNQAPVTEEEPERTPPTPVDPAEEKTDPEISNKLDEEKKGEDLRRSDEKPTNKFDDIFGDGNEVTIDDDSDIPVNQAEFEAKAKEKVEKFSYYVKTILEGVDRVRASSLIERALGLFVSDTSFIEVSSVNRPNKDRFTIRKYLQRLSLVSERYTRVEVTEGEVVKISNLRKAEDGKWYGTVSHGQRFSGYKDNVLAYTDYTVKNYTIVLNIYEPPVETMRKVQWDVQLSDISVYETTP